MFFVTVACGILSGFHSTQTAIISRTMKSEKQGRMTFYNMMILEGFIAMVWAAAAMGVYNLGLQEANAALATGTVGVGLPATSWAPWAASSPCWASSSCPSPPAIPRCAALRLTISDSLHIDQSSNAKRLGLSAIIFALVAVILVFAKMQPRRLQHPVALLRLVQPDPVPVRLPGHLRLDVREQARPSWCGSP